MIEQVEADLREARLARDTEKVGALSMLLAALKDAEKSAGSLDEAWITWPSRKWMDFRCRPVSTQEPEPAAVPAVCTRLFSWRVPRRPLAHPTSEMTMKPRKALTTERFGP